MSKERSHQKMDLSKSLYSSLSEDLLSWHQETEKKLTEKMTTSMNECKKDLEMKSEWYIQENMSTYQKKFANFATDHMNSKGESVKHVIADELRNEIRLHTETDRENLRSYFSSNMEKNLRHYENKLMSSIETKLNQTFQTFSRDFLKSMELQLSTNCETQSTKLLASLSNQLKDKSQKMETNILMKLMQDLTRKLDSDLQLLSNNIISNLNKEMALKMEVQKNVLENAVNAACQKDLLKRTDDLSKKVFAKQDNIVQETNIKIEDCLQTINHIKRQTEDLLNHKMELQGAERILLQIYEKPSLRTQWVEWALKESRTEFMWKVTEVRSLLRGERHFQSEIFIDKEFGFKMRAKLKLRDAKWISLCTEFVKEEEEFTHTRPPIYYHRKTAILLDQSQERGQNRNIVRVLEPDFSCKEAEKLMEGFSGWPQFILMNKQKSKPRPLFEIPTLRRSLYMDQDLMTYSSQWTLKHRNTIDEGFPYVVQDALCIRILIEPLSILWKSFASNDGTLLWRIEDYSQKKKDSLEGVIECIYSDYFYSGPRGYRMQIRFEFNSDGNLATCVVFMKGEWDDSLCEKFPHKTTLKILDQSDSKQKNHLIRSQESESTLKEYLDPIPLSELERTPYLINDCLSVKVNVEPKGK